MTGGLTFAPTPNGVFTVTSYRLRRTGDQVRGVVWGTYTGAALTADASANYGDVPLFYFPEGWRNGSGIGRHRPVLYTGVSTFWGRMENNVNGQFTLTHGSFPGQTLATGRDLQIDVDHSVT